LSGQGTAFLEYDPEEMNPTALNFLENEVVNDVVKISDDQLFLLTDKRVLIFDLHYNRFTEYLDQPYKFGRYEALSDILFLCLAKKISGYDRLSGDLIAEKEFQEEILDFQILYNK
jgi:hypothetical protein